MCFRHVLSIEAFENQHSTTVPYSTWGYRPDASIQEFSVVIGLRIELRKRSRTSIPPPLLTQHGIVDQIPQTQVFSTAIVLRIELRQLYISRTVVAARYVRDACIRLEAFENLRSTTVAYLTWYNSRNTALQLFPVAIVLRTELRPFYLSRTVVVARCASDTCFLQKRSRTRIPPPLLAQHAIIDEIPQYQRFVL
ncbi:hypothetical protein ANTQUA_LOCUS6922 [Anthophora quadrimaculata]